VTPKKGRGGRALRGGGLLSQPSASQAGAGLDLVSPGLQELPPAASSALCPAEAMGERLAVGWASCLPGGGGGATWNPGKNHRQKWAEHVGVLG
jgi:hypothetical protein